MIAQLETLEATALSPDPTLPPGALFPWLVHVRPTPTSSVPMLIGQITPTIFNEALRRTPNHKAAGTQMNNNTEQKKWTIALKLVKMYARGRYANTLKVKVNYVPT